MTNRITDAILNQDVRVINNMLGNPTDDYSGTPGVVTLSRAYGGVRVEVYCEPAGSYGVRGLSDGHQTKREAHNFMRGMIEALRLVERKNQ